MLNENLQKKRQTGMSNLYCPVCKMNRNFIFDKSNYTCISCGTIFNYKNGKLQFPDITDKDIELLSRQVPVIFDK